MAGLLDFLQTPAGMGLLSAAAGGLAGARRGTPINNIGRGAVSGLMGYSNAQDQIRADEENALQRQYREMQMEQAQAAMAKQKAEQAWRAGLPAMMKPKLTGTSEQGNMLADQQAAFGAEGVPSLVDSAQYAQPDAPLNMAYGMDKQGLQDYMMQADSPYADKIMENMLMPSTEKPQLVTVYDEQGRPMQKWLRPGEADGITVGMGKPDTASQSSVGQMLAEMNRLPPNDPMRRVYQQAIDKATTHAPAAQMNNYGSPVAGIGPDGNPVFFQTSKGGGAPSIVPGVAPPPKAPEQPSEGERTAAGYLGRMKAAEDLVGKAAGGEATVATTVAAAIPKVGDYAERVLMTPEQQKFKQAADDWIRAKLRKESGAVIADEEMKREYQTYFPQPGDSPAVIKQKAQARKQAEQQMLIGAGRAVQGKPKPNVGFVKNGYRFIGGDPANRQSWVKVNQ